MWIVYFFDSYIYSSVLKGKEIPCYYEEIFCSRRRFRKGFSEKEVRQPNVQPSPEEFFYFCLCGNINVSQCLKYMCFVRLIQIGGMCKYLFVSAINTVIFTNVRVSINHLSRFQITLKHWINHLTFRLPWKTDRLNILLKCVSPCQMSADLT